MNNYSILKKEVKNALSTISPLLLKTVEEMNLEVEALVQLTCNKGVLDNLADLICDIECDESSSSLLIHQHLMTCSCSPEQWTNGQYIFDSLFFAISDNTLKGDLRALVARAIWTDVANQDKASLVRWPSKETLIKQRCSVKTALLLLELLDNAKAEEWKQAHDKNMRALERARKRLQTVESIDLEPLVLIGQG